jgi:hypothetical protein
LWLLVAAVQVGQIIIVLALVVAVQVVLEQVQGYLLQQVLLTPSL